MQTEDRIKREWLARLPDVPIDVLWRSVASFLVSSDDSPATMADQLLEIRSQAYSVASLLDNLAEPARLKLDAEYQSNVPSAELAYDFRALALAARNAEAEMRATVKRGHGGRKGRRNQLVRELIHEFEAQGIEISAAPNGKLAIALGLVSDSVAGAQRDLGDRVEIVGPIKDIPGTIRNALKVI